MFNPEKSASGGKTKLNSSIRSKLAFSILIMLLTLAFVFNKETTELNNSANPTVSQTQNPAAYSFNNTGGRFLFGAMDTYFDEPNNYTNYNELKFNLWHTYMHEEWNTQLNRHVPRGRLHPNDGLMNDVSNYSAGLIGKINSINTLSNNNNMLFWNRPKIEWLCYGQSSIYEAETIGLNDPLWFYSFNQSIGTSEPDHQYNNGKYVLHCSSIESGPGAKYVLKGLKANTEQCKNENHWTGDNEGAWHIKPRIRIDSMFARTNPETPVCSIKVFKDDGTTVLKEVIIKAKYFKDVNGNYDGRYIDNYDFPAGTNLEIAGAWGSKWWYSARGTDDDEIGFDNHADIQVYWYDNCEMWIDYVKVENDVASDLLSDDPSNPNWVQYNTWLEQEVTQIVNASNPGAVYKFYLEHFEFNNIPCIKYVNDKLKLHSGNTVDLIADFDDWAGGHLRWGQHESSHTAEYIYNNIISEIGFTQFFFESYPLTSKYMLISL